MGGPGASTSQTKKIIESTRCQKCEMKTHQADECPFIYSAYKRVKCKGLRKLLISNSVANKGRKYLACQYTQCKSFEWLDLAIKEMKRTEKIPKQHKGDGCFECGLEDHWHDECPWMNQKCPYPYCTGTRLLRISTSKKTDGDKYLMCSVCKDQQWLSEAIEEMEELEARLESISGDIGSSCSLE